ncbi:hypothetical protein CF327_g6889 [Tilletia walkeri]|nr:hypothetical protein CF327_g6889 [Tilletia walkeri]
MAPTSKAEAAPGVLLGRGAFGAVYKVRMADGRVSALKLINVASVDEAHLRLILQEADLHAQTKHPSIVQAFSSEFDQQRSTLSIFLEYADGGDLQSYITSGVRPTARQVQAALGQLTDALHFLHNFSSNTGSTLYNTIIHRDVKPGNILISRGNFLIADLGLARNLRAGSVGVSLCGTRDYMAPEVLQEQPYTTKIDIFSLGVTLLQFINGTLPFQGSTLQTRLDAMRSRPSVPEAFEDIRQMLVAMVSFSPHARPDTAEILGHNLVINALQARDISVLKQENEELRNKIVVAEKNERTAVLSQATIQRESDAYKAEVRRTKNELALALGSTRCTNKDECIARAIDILTSPAASRDRAPDRAITRGRTSAANHSKQAILEAMSCAYDELRKAGTSKSFTRDILIETAKNKNLLPQDIDPKYIGDCLTAARTEWKAVGKAWSRA